MSDLTTFIHTHWALCIVTAGLFLGIIVTELRRQLSSIQHLSPAKAVVMINRDSASVIDIRPTEVYQNGHIVGAQNVPMDQLDAFAQSHHSGPIIVVCQRGNSSQSAIAHLASLGVKNLYNLEGGTQAWIDEGFPVGKS